MRPSSRSSFFARLVVAGLLFWCAAWTCDAWADAAAQPATGIEPAADNAAATQQLIDTLKDPQRLAALIAALENAQKAAGTVSPAPAVAPAVIPAPSAAAAKPVTALKPGSLGSELIAHGTRMADTVSSSLLLAARGISDVPDLIDWLHRIMQDPVLLLRGGIAVARLVAVMLIALAGELLVRRLTRRFYATLAADAHREDDSHREDDPHRSERAAAPANGRQLRGWPLLRRLPIILTALTVDLLPAFVFLGIATLALGAPLVAAGTVRMVILAVVDAYVIVRIVGAVACATFGASSARLRLLPVDDEAARYLMIWERRIAITIVFGYGVSQVALLFGMDSETQEGVLRLISLMVDIMLIRMVLRSRANVAARLSGSGTGLLGALRMRLASVWHVYAVIFLAGVWIVYAAEIRDGFERLLDFMLSILVVALAARIVDIVLVGALDRSFSAAASSSTRFARIEERVVRYHRPVRILLRLIIVAAAAVALFQIWGFDSLAWFSGNALGGRLATSAGTLALTLAVALVLWEAINITTQIYLDELSQQGAVLRAARLRTIVPLLRNALLITLLALIFLTALSELGVNIGPLLAGASIFGVALGFGSQKLVQDFITGIFLLAENAMQVGDAVTAAGLSGTVEYLSIRTLRLRAGDGSVHLIPFSSVSTVTNSNRGVGNAAVSVTVDYEEDTDRVGAVLTRIAKEMRDEPAFTAGMLSDLQLWGVDRVDGTTATLVGQIVCTDAARWGVQREFNRRVKLAFQKEGIRLSPVVAVTGFRHPMDIRLGERAADVETPKEAPVNSAAVNSLGAAPPA